MQLFKNEFVNIELRENNFLYVKWTDKTADMSVDFFKQVNLWYIDYFDKYAITSFMINTQDFKFAIIPEVQEWVGTQIIPKVIASGLKKLAFIVSEEIIAQLSIEQTMSESKSDEFTLLYFDNEAKANTWLNS